MPRLSDGTYQLPAGNPVQSGTVISATSWGAPTMSDLENEMTNSLDRNGRGGMLAPFRFLDGTAAAPGITWTGEPSSGLYRAAAGDMRFSVLNADKVRVNANGLQQFTGGTWYQALGYQHVRVTGSILEFIPAGAAAVAANLTGPPNSKLRIFQDDGTTEGLRIGMLNATDTEITPTATGPMSVRTTVFNADGSVELKPSGDSALRITRGIQTYDVYLEDTGNEFRIQDVTNGRYAFRIDPLAGTRLTYAGIDAFQTNAAGALLARTSPGDVVFTMATTLGNRFAIEANATNRTQLRNYYQNTGIELLGSDAGENGDVPMANFSPVSPHSLYVAGTEHYRIGSGTFLMANSGANELQFYNAAFATRLGRIRIDSAGGLVLQAEGAGQRTSLSTAGGARFAATDGFSDGSSAVVQDGGGTERVVGLGVMPPEDFPGAKTLAIADLGKQLRFTGVAGATLTLPNGLPDGFTCVVQNSVAQTLTLSATTTLEWYAGGQIVTGNRTIPSPGGVATVTHVGSNVWRIWGAGIA